MYKSAKNFTSFGFGWIWSLWLSSIQTALFNYWIQFYALVWTQLSSLILFPLVFCYIHCRTDKFIFSFAHQSFWDSHVFYPMTTSWFLLLFLYCLLCSHCHSYTCRSLWFLFEHSFVLFPKNSRHRLNFLLLSWYPGHSIRIFTKSRLVNYRPQSLLEYAIQVFLGLLHPIIVSYNYSPN